MSSQVVSVDVVDSGISSDDGSEVSPAFSSPRPCIRSWPVVFWSIREWYSLNNCCLPSRLAQVPAKKLTRARLDTNCAPRAVALMMGGILATKEER